MTAPTDRFWMISDIIEGEKIECEEMKRVLRLCYYRGLSHSDDKRKIMSWAADHALAEMAEFQASIEGK